MEKHTLYLKKEISKSQIFAFWSWRNLFVTRALQKMWADLCTWDLFKEICIHVRSCVRNSRDFVPRICVGGRRNHFLFPMTMNRYGKISYGTIRKIVTLRYSQFRASCDGSFVNKEFLQYRLSATVNAKVIWSDRKTQSISFFDPITLTFIVSERRYCKNFLLFQTVEPCAEFDKVQRRDKDENRKVIDKNKREEK